MSVSVGNEFNDMINVPSSEDPSMLRVKPFDPENSYVYLKLACEGGIIDACMPLGSLTPERSHDATLFHDWIEAGAPTD